MSATTPSSTLPVTAWLGEFMLLSALWGASFLFMRMGASEFGPLPTAGLRVLLAALFLCPILLYQGQWPALRQHWKPALLSGLVNSAIPFALYSWAVLHITTGLASILNATVPLFGALVALARTSLPDRLRAGTGREIADVDDGAHRFSIGSSHWRNPSPSWLKASTVRNRVRSGNTSTHHA